MVSIIIPVYNTAKYLDDCLSSVLKQSYQDWECILVDDGSTDESGIICDSWTTKDSRIIVIHQENQGVSVARNNGLHHAHGEYVCFIDSDDWVEASYLKNLVENVENAELTVSGIIHEYTNAVRSVYLPAKNKIFSIIEDSSFFVELNRQSLLYGPVVKLYRVGIIKENNIEFPRGCSFGEDLVFNYNYLRYANVISCVSSADYHYRMVGETSLSGKLRPDQFEEDYGQWKIQRQFYIDKSIWTEEARVFMYTKLWGIVYDGIFLFYKLDCDDVRYFKKILNIEEIKELQFYSCYFNASKWIKWAIINKVWWVFYIMKRYIKSSEYTLAAK